MIFVTVGTHEQPFDRLVECVDRLKQERKIQQDVFIQTGYSQIVPRFCVFEPFIGFEDMNRKILESKIVITHGGPGSIMSALYSGKIPIVVPRRKEYGEHVDNHQVLFTKKLEEIGKVIAVYEIGELEERLRHYDAAVVRLRVQGEDQIDPTKRVAAFAESLEDLARRLLKR